MLVFYLRERSGNPLETPCISKWKWRPASFCSLWRLDGSEWITALLPQSITWLLYCRSVGAGPRWTDPGSGDRQRSVWARAGRLVEEEEGGGENDQRRVHVWRRSAGGGQSYDVMHVATRSYGVGAMTELCTFVHLTGSCRTTSWFNSTPWAASILPCAWCLSSWRRAASPTTCGPGKAVCLRRHCWTCALMSARGWPTWRAPTSSTEIW